MTALKAQINKISILMLCGLALAGCGGGSEVSYNPSASGTTNPTPTIPYTPPFISPSPSIGAAAQACVNTPPRGTYYYYCDCGTGAEASCKPGNDANSGTDPLFPRQTIGNASSRLSSLLGTAEVTVALCKGGAFDSATGSHRIGTNRCTEGAPCTDVREYNPPTFTGVAKPIINNPVSGSALFIFSGTNNGGVRMLNLKLQGAVGSTGSRGFFFYQGARDVTMCNLDMDAFSIAVYNESGAGNTKNIKLTGSYITNSSNQGYLGGGDNTELSDNYWLDNGGTNSPNHALYFASSDEIRDVVVRGNYVRGQHGPTCRGVAMVAHMAVDGLLVKDNVVDIAASATTEGCWGIAFNNVSGGTKPIYHRRAVFSGNTIINGGNLALNVSGCPDCVIENNLIINETSKSGIGIGVSNRVRPGFTVPDDMNTRNIIRNNTIWYGPNATGGVGIDVGEEGTGHIIANNSVTYSAGTGAFNCFKYPLTLASYAFINNNHCESATSNTKWEAALGSLALWRAYSGFDLDSVTGNPLFTTAGTNFTPSTGSPLIGMGNTVNRSVLDFNGATRPNPPAIGAYEP